MIYEQQILQILAVVGQRGISISALVKHVYNGSCTLFEQPDLQDVHRQVRQYLLRNSKSSKPLIENAGRRGVYRLNARGLSVARQLMVNASKEQDTVEEPEDTTRTQDFSLSLFD